jgi:hypothetical protein
MQWQWIILFGIPMLVTIPVTMFLCRYRMSRSKKSVIRNDDCECMYCHLALAYLRFHGPMLQSGILVHGTCV